MGRLMAYSGLTTKVRAMESNLITPLEYNEIMNLSSVYDVVTYLEHHKGYHDIFEGTNLSALHRGDLEQLLTLSVYKDFAKIYNFSSVKQRKFLDLYFMKYETHLLKQVIREIMNSNTVTIDVPSLTPYYSKFSSIDIALLSQVHSISECIEALNGTKYYAPLSRVHSLTDVSLFDYEICLDLYFFSTVYKGKDKYLNGDDLKVITSTYGTKIDLLNIQWIYRSKKYYNISNAKIFALLIPIYYKLNKHLIRSLVEAENIQTLDDILRKSYYGRYLNDATSDSLEFIYHKNLHKLHSINFKNNPYSMACIDTYLFLKHAEISKLITLTECIRYSFTPDEIKKIINDEI